MSNESKIELLEKKNIKKAEKNLMRTAFFTTYPFWIFIQNISFYFTVFYFINLRSINISMLKVKSTLSVCAVLLFIGALASTIGAGINHGQENFYNSLSVLPNYLYWGVLIIILGNTALFVTNLIAIYRICFWGLIASIATYFFFSPIFSFLPFYRFVSPNNFSYILILFSPISTAYIHYKYKNNFYTYLLILIITLAGFMSGSRSGSILALSGAVLTVVMQNWVRMFIALFFLVFITVAAPQIIESNAVKSTILSLNKRTYNLIYSTDETLATDQSYLIRLAMIEKGLNIFEKNPIEGIGINNFSKVTGEIDFNFEGAEFIESKEDILKEGISAHNSYILFLAEGGLLLFIPMILLIFYPIIYFAFNFTNILEYEKAIFISMIFIAIHSWFISGLLNVYTWFVIGIINSYIIYKRKNV